MGKFIKSAAFSHEISIKEFTILQKEFQKGNGRSPGRIFGFTQTRNGIVIDWEGEGEDNDCSYDGPVEIFLFQI